MKKIKNISNWIISIIMGMILFITSCEYQEFADTDYPDQLIYMPAAYYNNFMIDAVPQVRGSSPTPGYPERFKVDTQSREFNVLLGVYRSGLYPTGSFKVNISVNTDTIIQLLNQPDALPLGTTLLPIDKFTIVPSVNMIDGERLAKFDLEVNLDFLLENSPEKIYATAIEISSPERAVNSDLATTIVVINTKIMKPEANFSVEPSAADSKTLNFTNTSENGLNYIWEFGDGKGVSTEKSPSYSYGSIGSYTVTLTTLGITGQEHQSTYSARIEVE